MFVHLIEGRVTVDKYSSSCDFASTFDNNATIEEATKTMNERYLRGPLITIQRSNIMVLVTTIEIQDECDGDGGRIGGLGKSYYAFDHPSYIVYLNLVPLLQFLL